MADGIIHIMENYNDPSPINLGTGEEITIKNLSIIIKNVIGYKGKINFDSSKPEGVKREILNNSKVKKLKWSPKFSLENGLEITYQNYLKELSK